jgi:SAM-dependent MidA family methyltransferase
MVGSPGLFGFRASVCQGTYLTWQTIRPVNVRQEPKLLSQITQRIAARGGWLPFDEYMHAALYTPGLGYYSHGSRKLGLTPQSGSDFVTAPELSPLFGHALAAQVQQALQASATRTVIEFGAGTGALAHQLLERLGQLSCVVERYVIVEVSSSLRERQRETLAAFADRITWLSELPAQFEGVLIGNEVLDAMPVTLLVRTAGRWYERGVAHSPQLGLHWQDRMTHLRPPLEIEGAHDYLTEVHPQAEAFIRTLGQRLTRGAIFMLDYGFPEREYYHPQRNMGTLMCHQAHRSDTNPLLSPGEKDITAHINFTGIAVAAQEEGLELLGYSTQARFLMNCGLLNLLSQLSAEQQLRETAHAQKLLTEHEMGELFKVIGWCKGVRFEALGFAQGDRSHTL